MQQVTAGKSTFPNSVNGLIFKTWDRRARDLFAHEDRAELRDGSEGSAMHPESFQIRVGRPGDLWSRVIDK
jgi:hypothetical protein